MVQAEETEISFLTPEKEVRVALSYDRVMLGLNINMNNVSGSDMRQVYIGIQRMAETWRSKDWWILESLAKYKTSLDIGESHVVQMAALWFQVETFRVLASFKTVTKTHCEAATNLSTIEIKMQSELLQKKWDKINTFTKEDVVKSENLDLLLDFLNNYITKTVEWLRVAELTVSHLEQLKDGKFPDDLYSLITSLSCLDPEQAEYLEVAQCFVELNRYRCNIDVGLPRSIHTVTKLYPISYMNIQLYLEDGNFYYKDERTNKLGQYNCTSHISWSSPTIPLCRTVTSDHCEKALVLDDVHDIIKSCELTYKTPEPIVRTSQDGILILSPNAVVIEGSKPIIKPVQYLIYTNQNLSIRMPDGTELNIPTGNSVTNPRILGTKLSKTEIGRAHV